MAKAKPQTQLEARITMIASRYDIGKQILKECGLKSPHGVIEKIAERHGINRDTAQKLRALANPVTGYSKYELNQWFREFKRTGFSLTITHFIKLISVPRGRKRDALTRKAIKQEWSSHQLQAEILALQGRRQVGGRPPKKLAGKNFEQELGQTLWSWRRWLDAQLEMEKAISPGIAREMKGLRRKIEKLEGLLDAE